MRLLRKQFKVLIEDLYRKTAQKPNLTKKLKLGEASLFRKLFKYRGAEDQQLMARLELLGNFSAGISGSALEERTLHREQLIEHYQRLSATRSNKREEIIRNAQKEIARASDTEFPLLVDTKAHVSFESLPVADDGVR